MAGRNPPPQRTYGGLSADERRAERRRKLMDAALEMFGTQGYSTASIERLCTKAGVSTRNFYEEFTGKEAVLIALHEQITEQARDAVIEALAGASPDATTRERVEPAIRAYVASIASDLRAARIAYVETVGVSQAVEQSRIRLRQAWSELLVTEAERAAARGEAVPRDFRLSAVVIIGAINNMVHFWSMNSADFTLEDVSAELTRLIMALLTAP